MYPVTQKECGWDYFTSSFFLGSIIMVFFFLSGGGGVKWGLIYRGVIGCTRCHITPRCDVKSTRMREISGVQIVCVARVPLCERTEALSWRH